MQENTSWVVVTCPSVGCHCRFGVPESVDTRLRETKESFCCPFGHSQSYGGDTEAQRLKKIIANKESYIETLQNQVEEKNKVIKELKPKKPRKKAVKKVAKKTT
jgi:hypothetical protein